MTQRNSIQCEHQGMQSDGSVQFVIWVDPGPMHELAARAVTKSPGHDDPTPGCLERELERILNKELVW